MRLFVAIAALLCLGPLAWLLIHTRRGATRWLGLAVLLPGALAIPRLIPADEVSARFFVGCFVVLAALRLWEVACRATAHPEMQRTFGRFLVYFANAECYWPDTPEARREARRAGRQRILRALLVASLGAALLALRTAWPALAEHAILRWVYFSYTLVFLVPSGIAGLTGLMMQTGLDFAEVFRNPALARSPRDFWSRRWNMAFHGPVTRLIFRPLGGMRRPFVGILAVFLFSALCHEYLVLISLGSTTGAWFAFFMLQGVATLVYGELRRRNRFRRMMRPALAVACHSLWFLLGVPLFLGPMLQMVAFDSWVLW